MSPKTKSVKAQFLVGDQLSLNLPDNYQKYNVSFNSVAVTTADLDYIFQWKQAIHLFIHDGSDFGYEFSQRAEALKELKSLEKLSFDLQKQSYNKLNIKDILFGPPALKSVNVLRASLSASEFKEYAKNQKRILKWGFLKFFDHISYFRDVVRV